jgi:Putative DNA-binding domain
MKRSKPINSVDHSSPPNSSVQSREDLRALQRTMASALFRPLDARWGMQKTWTDGRPTRKVAAEFIKPNDRLNSFERLEIYNRQYWFRVLDCLHDDYPGLGAILGTKKFTQLATAYLAKYPSNSFTLRNLGERLEQFIREEPGWTSPHEPLALDMVRFEWAQTVAFDGPSKRPITADDILGKASDHLTLGLQPYLSLLLLNYAVDDFLIAVKRREEDALRGEASNAIHSAPRASNRRKPVRRPKKQQIFLAVHRYENQVYSKRLESEEYQILAALARGVTVAAACEAVIGQSLRTNIDWTETIKNWFDTWTALGWFCLPQ